MMRKILFIEESTSIYLKIKTTSFFFIKKIITYIYTNIGGSYKFSLPCVYSVYKIRFYNYDKIQKIYSAQKLPIWGPWARAQSRLQGPRPKLAKSFRKIELCLRYAQKNVQKTVSNIKTTKRSIILCLNLC